MIKKFFHHIVTEKENDKRIKDILNNLNISNRILIKVKSINGILLNSKNVTVNAIVKTNDIIELMIEDMESENIIPEKMDLSIVFEDEDILIVDKPANLVVHPTSYHFTGTLANGVVYYLSSKGIECKFRPVNRLDKDTSGLVLIAKSQFSHSILSNQLISKEFKKEYVAVVHNRLNKDKDIINLPIARKPDSIIERYVHSDGQAAQTEYEVISQNNNGAVLKVNLLTGRTHQIRVHFSYLGHPLYGDEIYGQKDEEIDRQALHCNLLKFRHPKLKNEMIFASDIPDDMNMLIHYLKLKME